MDFQVERGLSFFRRRRHRRHHHHHHLDYIFVLDQDQVAGMASLDHSRKVTSALCTLEVRLYVTRGHKFILLFN